MYADWSSLTLQLQSLGTATQSVLAKLPQEDGKQVGRLSCLDSSVTAVLSLMSC
jgi:hypothetical protein